MPLFKGPYSVSVSDVDLSQEASPVIVRLYYPSRLQRTNNQADSSNAKKNAAAFDKSNGPLWLPATQYAHGYADFFGLPRLIGPAMVRAMIGRLRVPVATNQPLISQSEWQTEPDIAETGNENLDTHNGANEDNTVRQYEPEKLQTDSQTYDQDGRIPVMVFSHGLGGNRSTYSYFCCDMASQGWVVAAVEHRDGSAAMTCNSNGDWMPYRHVGPEENEYNVRNSQLKQRVEEVRSVVSFLHKLDNGTLPPDVDDQSRSSDFIGGLSLSRKEKGESEKNIVNVDHLEKSGKGPCLEATLPAAENSADDESSVNSYSSPDSSPTSFYTSWTKKHHTGFISHLVPFHQSHSFKDRLDFTRLTMAGHSFGGATTLASVRSIPDFQCAIAMDAWMFPLDEDHVSQPSPTPLLFLNTHLFSWKENNEAIEKHKSATLAASAKKDSNAVKSGVPYCIKVIIERAGHQNQSDGPLILPRLIAKTCGPVEPLRALEVNDATVHAFLLGHLPPRYSATRKTVKDFENVFVGNGRSEVLPELLIG